MQKYNWKFKKSVNLFFYKIRKHTRLVRFLTSVICTLRSALPGRKKGADRIIRKAISNDNKFIYFANPKVATRSILSFLEDLQQSDLAIVESSYLAIEREYGNIDAFFTFSFVRNPWARTYSCWRDKISTHSKFCDIFILTRFKGLYPDMPFDEFVQWLGSDRGSDAYADRHWMSQAELLKRDEHGVSLDFIGKVENINADFKEVLRHLELDDSIALIHKNSSHAKDQGYTKVYTQKMIETVARRYQQDIKLFGYRFDD